MFLPYFLKILISKSCSVFIHMASLRMELFPVPYQYTRYPIFSQYKDHLESVTPNLYIKVIDMLFEL